MPLDPGDVLVAVGASRRLPNDVIEATLPDIDVRRFGAVGVVGTDDRAAIQAAIDAAGVWAAALDGEVTVHFPAGRDYHLTATTTSGGVLHHLSMVSDNVHLDFGAGARLVSTVANAAMIFLTGSAKPAGIANWLTNRPVDVTPSNLTGTYAKGVRTVTLATAADAANFSVGDEILIRTGQTIAGTAQPDAEINRVIAADVGTGVLTLEWPTVKPYAQEYYISGTSGETSTAVTANAAPYGVANISDRILRNVSFKRMGFDSTNERAIIVGNAAIGMRVEDCEGAVTNAGFLSFGTFRWAWYKNNRTRTRGGLSTTTHSHYTPDSCSSDVWIVDNAMSAEATVAKVHLHEGAARCTVRGNTIDGHSTDASVNAVSMRGRAYDHIVKDNHITISGTACTAIYADPSCDGGGIIADNIITVPSASATAIGVSGEGWNVGYNQTNGIVSLFGTSTSVTVEQITGSVSAATQTAIIGTIPARALILNVYVVVHQAFDSDGTDLLSVGFSGTITGYAAAVDVSTVGRKTTTLGGFTYSSSSVRQALVTYAAGGSAPTTGKAFVVIEFTRVPHLV